MKKWRIIPDNEKHQRIYTEYQDYLLTIYDNANTRHFYEYGMYCLLQFLNTKGITDIKHLSLSLTMEYIKATIEKIETKREVMIFINCS